jgi:hypothetical protein
MVGTMMSDLGFGGLRIPERWACACVGGGVALPCTAFSYWQTGSEVSVSAVAVGGFVTGFLLARSNAETGGAGIPVGIVGGLPILWAVFDTYVGGTAAAEPVWFELVGGAFLVGFTVAGFGVAALAGEVGVRIGARVAGSDGRRDRSAESPGTSPTGGERHAPWVWASVLAVQPLLTAASLLGLLAFGVVSTATGWLQLPAFLPLVPGVAALVALGTAYLYTPLYLAALALDYRQVRSVPGDWRPSRWVLLGAGSQLVYVVVPVIQAYGVDTFEELVFGVVELTALLVAGLTTVLYLRGRDDNFAGAPRLVTRLSAVYSKLTRRDP